ncbi:MAG: hypothetical protein AAGD35_11695 [Actinomycetota bacterium]
MNWSEVRWAHLGYVALLGFFGTIAAGLFIVVMIEVHGPSERSGGAVVELVEGEREACRRVTDTSGRTVGPQRCRIYPTFSVLGVRDDGSNWVVVGEGAYEAVETGEVDVTSSTVTGRVVRLQQGSDEWTLRSSGLYAFAIGLLVFVSALGAAYEYVRRTKGRFVEGPMRRSDLVMIGPSVLAGLVVVWFILFWRTFNL